MFCDGDCTYAMCGDGYHNMLSEQCDDGNAANNDGCIGACLANECGDGIVWEGVEGCDDGNVDDSDECLSTCVSASCGDGALQPDVEQCDDGNMDGTDACNNSCVNSFCGDGVIWQGMETCDDGNMDSTDDCPLSCEPAVCGDGYTLANVEDCDDGNMAQNDSCHTDCTDPYCGDGFIWQGVEDCEDGNMVGTDACTNACLDAACGDGFLWQGMEVCDDGNMIDDACTTGCTVGFCGDGYHWAGMEDCDDGNMVDDDGCANDCTLDVHFTCKSLLLAAPNTPSGMYLLDPDGLGGHAPFITYCDMTTDGGGWTLMLNRVVDSDQLGQPDLDQTLGAPDVLRATNWQFNIDLFWAGAQHFVFADKENANCQNCNISNYDSAIRVPKPAGNVWARTCPGNSAQINITKLVGPAMGNGVAFQCADSLGWGNCAGSVCHYGTHSNNTQSDGQWSQNGTTELHFPSAYSTYKSYGNVNAPPSAWCRSCGGGLAAHLNSSTTCCSQGNMFNARSRWTIWVR